MTAFFVFPAYQTQRYCRRHLPVDGRLAQRDLRRRIREDGSSMTTIHGSHGLEEIRAAWLKIDGPWPEPRRVLCPWTHRWCCPLGDEALHPQVKLAPQFPEE